MLALDAGTLLAIAGAAHVVVREYVASHPEQAQGIIPLFRAAQQHGFKDWHQLREIVERKGKVAPGRCLFSGGRGIRGYREEDGHESLQEARRLLD